FRFDRFFRLIGFVLAENCLITFGELLGFGQADTHNAHDFRTFRKKCTNPGRRRTTRHAEPEPPCFIGTTLQLFKMRYSDTSLLVEYFRGVLDFVQRNPFILGVSLGNVAWTKYHRWDSCRCDDRGVRAVWRRMHVVAAAHTVDCLAKILDQAR